LPTHKKAGDHVLKKSNVPLLGVIENMSWIEAGGERIQPFGEGGGAKLAQQFNAPLLAQLPLDPALGTALDRGEIPAISAEFAAAAMAIAGSESSP
jgi:ATPases involved in chromosome partitioning